MILIDPDEEKVRLINNGMSPIEDISILDYLQHEKIHLRATIDEIEAYSGVDVVLVAVPTNFKEEISCFDTSIVESVINSILQINKEATIIIKSTVPVGFTKNISCKFNTSKIFFSLEFLREGQALFDCQHPSRIIVGTTRINKIEARVVADLLYNSIDENCPVQIIGASEAEAVKLFSNAYLAMRVCFLMNWILTQKKIIWNQKIL